jgi:hypothetical protein
LPLSGAQSAVLLADPVLEQTVRMRGIKTLQGKCGVEGPSMKVKRMQFVAVLLSISYVVVAGAAYKRVFDDGYYGELMRHGETSEEAVVPFYLPQPVGFSGLQRRALAPFEYPCINLIAVPIGICLTVLLLSCAWKMIFNAGKLRRLSRERFNH